jgi:hypothetical protein
VQEFAIFAKTLMPIIPLLYTGNPSKEEMFRYWSAPLDWFRKGADCESQHTTKGMAVFEKQQFILLGMASCTIPIQKYHHYKDEKPQAYMPMHRNPSSYRN